MIAGMIHFRHNARRFYGGPVGPLAMIICELGQARKGAAAADDSCAGMWLAGLPPKLCKSFSSLPGSGGNQSGVRLLNFRDSLFRPKF